MARTSSICMQSSVEVRGHTAARDDKNKGVLYSHVLSCFLKWALHVCLANRCCTLLSFYRAVRLQHKYNPVDEQDIASSLVVNFDVVFTIFRGRNALSMCLFKFELDQLRLRSLDGTTIFNEIGENFQQIFNTR